MLDMRFTTSDNELIQVYTANGYSQVILEIEDQDHIASPRFTVLNLTPQEAATLGTRLIALATICDDNM